MGTRSKVSTVRLDSEILYLARVAALNRRISMRSWLEEAITEKLSHPQDVGGPGYEDEITREILLHAEDEDEMREIMRRWDNA